MRRRDFINVLASGTVAWPMIAVAQQLAKIPRIGFLGFAPSSAWQPQIESLRGGLRELGYVEGQNIIIEFVWAEKVDEYSSLAAELVHRNVDVIVAPASTQVEPARKATSTIPIVFAQHAEPVGLGHVASLARPGGNITGVSMVLTDIAVKGLELLVHTLTGGTQFGALWNPTTPTHPGIVRALTRTAEVLGVKLVLVPAQSVEDFTIAFATLSKEGVAGFVVPSSPLTNSQPIRLAELALMHRLPGMFANKVNVEAGGLMSYGPDFNYMYRLAAHYIDKILKGTKPADLAVEQASKYELVINLKTANTLGITIPPIVMIRADILIE